MKYKVNDRVRIKSLDWYNRYTNGTEVNCKHYPFICDMKKYCGQIMTINVVRGHSYDMIEDDGTHAWTDEMIEGLVEEEMPLDKAGQITDFEYEGLAYTLPEGYRFVDENGNEILTSKIILEKKKKEYPKTYEECCKVLNTDDDSIIDISVPLHYNHLLISFTQLLICRDAYWKIAGDEMGLDKSWKPISAKGYCTYAIIHHTSHIRKSRPCADSALLEFPTEEMRDAFYENFKELIESCKELL